MIDTWWKLAVCVIAAAVVILIPIMLVLKKYTKDTMEDCVICIAVMTAAVAMAVMVVFTVIMWSEVLSYLNE